jgi:hypothetical protein
MMPNFKPQNLMVWLRYIDVNGLNDAEGRELSSVDINDEMQLNKLILNWVKPRYLEWDERNRQDMRLILEQSAHWKTKDIMAIFDQIQFPSGQKIEDPNRFLTALRAIILN